MRKRSVTSEGHEIRMASELIQLGARLQVLEAETGLSRERLIKLHKEIKGVSPSKGMLPFSADWFLRWEPNVHASMFVGVYDYLHANTDLRGAQALITSYRMYLEHAQAGELEPILTLTRAWTLLRFFGSMLQSMPCTRCGGNFVADKLQPRRTYVCGLCRPPSRAGTANRHGARAGSALVAAAPTGVVSTPSKPHPASSEGLEHVHWPPSAGTLEESVGL